MGWIGHYGELIGGVLGAMGAIIVAIPLMTEIEDRRQWDGLANFSRDYSLNRTGPPKTEEEYAAEREIRDRMLDDRLGRHKRHRRIALTGFIFLVGAFIFISIGASYRLFGS